MTVNTLSPILATAVADVTGVLTSFAADPLFAEKFGLVFGTVVSAEQFLQLVAVLPEIEVLTDGELNGALGAFSAQTGKIYLSAGLVTGDSARLRSVLIEEIGHFVDAQVNSTDTAGDEGELFSALVRGVGLSATELSRIKTEDDHAVVMIDGQATAIEMAFGSTGYKQFGTLGNDYLTGIDTDSSGNTYVLGDTYIAKYDTNGSLVWTRQLDLSGYANSTYIRASGVSVDTLGNIYVSAVSSDSTIVREGAMSGSIDNLLSVSTNLPLSAYLLKFDQSGSQSWVKQIGSSGNNSALAVTTDANNNVYVSGETAFKVFDGNTGEGAPIYEDQSDAYVSKFDGSGNQLWMKQFNRSTKDNALGLGTDANGNVYVSGGGSENIGYRWDTSAFLGNFDSSGNQLWLQQTGSSFNAVLGVTNVVSDSNGSVYIAGVHPYPDTTFIAKYSSTGTLEWKQTIPSSFSPMMGLLFPAVILLDQNNNLYVAGAQGLNPWGTTGNVWLRKYNSSGGLLWEQKFGSGYDAIVGISTDQAGNIYLAGNTYSSLPGNTNAGGQDAFLVSFDNNGNLLTTTSQSTVSLTVTPISVTEDSTTNLVYTFTRNGSTANALTVNYSIAGTANGADYTGATPGIGKTITFAAGSATATLTIDPAADTTAETNETVSLTLVAGTGYTIGTTMAVTGTITNDDLPTIAPGTVQLTTNAGYLDFDVSSSKVVWRNGESIYFYNGTSTQQIAEPDLLWQTDMIKTPQILGNNIIWGVREYEYSSNDVNRYLLYLYNSNTGTKMQLTDRAPSYALGNNIVVWSDFFTERVPDGPSSYFIEEYYKGLYLYQNGNTLQLSNTNIADFKVSGDKVVWYEVNSPFRYTGSSDNGQLSGVIKFYDGNNTRTLGSYNSNGTYLDILGDKVVWRGYDGSDSEIYFYNGTNTIQLTNNSVVDIFPRLSDNGVVWGVYDGNSSYEIYVYDNNNNTIKLADVNMKDFGWSAQDSFDVSGNNIVWSSYDGNDFEIYLYDGTTIIQVTDNGVDDIEPQTSGNSIVWKGQYGSDYHLYQTNLDNSATQPTVSLTVTPNSVTEDGTTNLVYTFTRTGDLTDALSVNYSIAGTADVTDYTGATPGTGKTITFAAGSATATLIIDPTADTTVETDETVSLTLATGTGYTVGTTTAVTGTITNDDFVTINLSPNGQTVVEGSTTTQTLSYNVTLSSSSTQTITVQYSTANGTALAGLDYTTTSGTLTFNPGVTNQTINIPILSDSINETDETFSLTLTSPTNAVLGTTKTVTTTITDTLSASVTTTLPANVTNLTLTGTTAINGTGNAKNNVITGNSANNILDGGAGNDTLKGGAGNDTYLVDSIRDVVIENLAEGLDAVQSAVTNTLSNNVENLTLTGTANINGTGNTLNNLITGNSGNNLLKGMNGNDTLTGSSGNDTLTGGSGNDQLTGGSGADQFLFGSGAAFAQTQFGTDTITDFLKGTDKLVLSKLSFNTLTTAVGGSLSSTEFATINTTTSTAKIVYNSGTGNLFYNQNLATSGLGTGGLFASLTGKPNLGISDFLIQS